MNDLGIEPQWIAAGAALVLVGAGGYVGIGLLSAMPGGRKALLSRLDRVAYEAVHQPSWCPTAWADSFTSITCCSPSAASWCSTRAAVAGLIFGGDQMSDFDRHGMQPLHV